MILSEISGFEHHCQFVSHLSPFSPLFCFCILPLSSSRNPLISFSCILLSSCSCLSSYRTHSSPFPAFHYFPSIFPPLFTCIYSSSFFIPGFLLFSSRFLFPFHFSTLTLSSLTTSSFFPTSSHPFTSLLSDLSPPLLRPRHSDSGSTHRELHCVSLCCNINALLME